MHRKHGYTFRFFKANLAATTVSIKNINFILPDIKAMLWNISSVILITIVHFLLSNAFLWFGRWFYISCFREQCIGLQDCIDLYMILITYILTAMNDFHQHVTYLISGDSVLPFSFQCVAKLKTVWPPFLGPCRPYLLHMYSRSVMPWKSLMSRHDRTYRKLRIYTL